jgi:GTP-binding protein EngB required for normal cell division
MDLREYEQRKFAIAEILRSVSAGVPEAGGELRPCIQDLFARLAEDRFNVVVVGRFNRGKSSLMNAILGVDRLPTGIIPLTSVITTVGYGTKERAILKYDNRILNKEVTIASLSQHLTQQNNPGNVQHIKTAEIQLPAEILRRGFYFVDTPGLGSVFVENTLTTEAFLPEADAFVLVTSCDSPLSDEEVRFFRAGSSSGRRIFVVLNKHDTVTPEQRETALAFVREHLSIAFGQTIPPVFSVSATEGLKAKQSKDKVLLKASGVPDLEKALLDFLLTDKSCEFLLRMCDRVRQVLQELPHKVEVDLLMQRIDAVSQLCGAKDERLILETGGVFPALHQLASCEICTHVADKIWSFLCNYQHDMIINNDEQKHFADRGGFCPFHVWQFQSVASPYSICAGHPPLLDRLATTLRQSASVADLQQIHAQLEELLPDQHACILCGVRDSAEREAIESTTRRLARDKARELNALTAICLPHFVMLVSATRDADLARGMLHRQAEVLERYSEDMKRYAIKHEGVRRYLASEEETTAAARGLLLMAGRRQVNFLPRHAHSSPADDGVSVHLAEKVSSGKYGAFRAEREKR